MPGSSDAPRRLRLPRPERERQLLRVAETLIARDGFDGVNIGEVAERAGVTRSVVYDYFGSKNGMYLACVRAARGEFEESLGRAVAGARDLPTWLLRGADAFFAVQERDPRRWATLFAVSAPLEGEFGIELAALRRRTIDRIADLLGVQLPQLDPERLTVFAHALSGTGEQLGRWWLAHPEIPRAQISHYFVEFSWAGLAGVSATGITAEKTSEPDQPGGQSVD